MTQGGDEKPVRVARVDRDVGDHLRIAKAEMGPRFARVGRLIDAVAHGQIGPDDPRAAADVNDVGIRGRNGDGADGAGRLLIE